MSKVESVEDILPRILRQYERKPKGWRVLSTPQGEMLVLGPDSSFQLKLIPLNPRQYTGAGVEIPDTDDKLDSIKTSPEYGLRPLSDNDIEGLINAISSPVLARTELENIIRRAPVPPAELNRIKSELILSGPVLTRPDLGSLGSETMKIQAALNKSASEEFRKRYPMRSGMYI
ncbi:MAG: hypothetical protein ACXADL_15440 [Candidatus Thorarchaeota archaeon]